MKFYNDPKLVAKTPVITVFLLEWANISQLWRMWHEHSALGQSMYAWISVQFALWFWINFYRVLVPDNKFAIRATIVGCILNAAVIFSVAYFRYVVGS